MVKRANGTGNAENAVKADFVSNHRVIKFGSMAAADRRAPRGNLAFTLIELLTVIAIIGVLAGLVVSLSGLATGKSRESRVRGEQQRLITGIEDYRQTMNAYPQDNQLVRPAIETSASLHERAGRNMLYYELGGAVFTQDPGGANPRFQPTGKTRADEVTKANLTSVFGVGGVENSARNERQVPYKRFTFKADQYAALDLPGVQNVNILTIPIKGPFDVDGLRAGRGDTGTPFKTRINPWFYDASSTNRHNMETYDLWAIYYVGKGTNVRVIKNWMTTTRPGVPSNE